MKENEIIKRIAIRERLLPSGLRRLAGEDAAPKRDRRHPLTDKPLPERITRLHFTDGSPTPATTENRHPFYDKIQKRWCVKIGKPAKVVRFKERSEAEAALEQARKKERINIIIDQDLNADPPPRRKRRWVPEGPERRERIAVAAHVTERADQSNDEEKAADDLEREREAHDEADMTKLESIEAPDADWTELSRSLGGIPRR